MKGVRLYLLDMDGTIYLSSEVIAGAPEAVGRLRQSARVLFLTNNSSKSRAAYFDKLTQLGFKPSLDEIYTSGMCAAEHLASRCKGKSVYLVGTEAFRAELIATGVTLTEERPDIVLLGYDTETTYNRIARACVYIREGATYYATHPDINCPAKGGYLPDAGAFIELIYASAGRKPEIIFGKPHAPLASAIEQRFSLSPSEICMVGDRLTTDIAFANANGFRSVLVLSGETTLEMAKSSAHKPTVTVSDITKIG